MKKGDKGKTTAADGKTTAEHSCCGDSCPMKTGDKSVNGKAEGHSCCGDSCPMKGKADGHEGMKYDMKADGHSCPMMDKDKDGKSAHAGHHDKMAGDGHSCCCACCNETKAEKKADAAV
jgi:hypothetical protein